MKEKDVILYIYVGIYLVQHLLTLSDIKSKHKRARRREYLEHKSEIMILLDDIKMACLIMWEFTD